MTARITKKQSWSVATHSLEAKSVEDDPMHAKLVVRKPSMDPRERPGSMVVAEELVVSMEELSDFVQALVQFVGPRTR